MRDPELIDASWRRSASLGVPVSVDLASQPVHDVDTGGVLMRAAHPVLAPFARSLDGTGFIMFIGDHRGRILGWFGDADPVRLGRGSNLPEVGASLDEGTVGTNALGTAIEARRPVYIDRDDHYVEQLRVFSCLGHPIVHPVTRRIVGALDLTGTTDLAHPLLASMVRTVAQGIEARLLEASGDGDRELLARFRAAGAESSKAVLAVGSDTFLTNRTALDQLQGDDLAVLRSLAPQLRTSRSRRVPLTLSGGRDVLLSIEPLRAGSVLTFDTAPEASAVAGPVHHCAASPTPGPGAPGERATITVVAGPPGSGRSTRACNEARGRRPDVIAASLASEEGGAAWVRAAERALSPGGWGGVVCLDDLDLVPDRLIAPVLVAVRREGCPDVTVVRNSIEAPTPRAAVLTSLATSTITLAPLAERREEIHVLATRMLAELRPGISLRLTPSVLEALAGHDWPGNLTELRHVMEHVARHRSSGDIVLGDLPKGYRVVAPARRIGALERAEGDAIVRALTKADGNKSRAAKILGISRTTLYSRMRQLHIAG